MDDEAEEKKCEEGAPAWLATFADLMSLLMCFFVLLLAFSELDVLKFKQLAGSMSAAFGVQREIKTKEIPKGTSVIAKEFSPGRPKPTALKVLRQQTTNDRKQNLDFRDGKRIGKGDTKKTAVKIENLKQALKSQIAKGSIEVTGNDVRTIIRIREKGSFPSGSARINPSFSPVMKKIAETVQQTPGQIHIAGHTDNVPINTFRFKSNWELSSARAVSILNELIRHERIDNNRLVIQGHADTRPLVPNTTAANRAINRRVEITIVKTQNTINEAPSLIKFSE
ncbi:MAG: type VI secretion system protein TssL, long form [Gammaproteobacteria bacterium]|nr:type VI secretion system protein TssL, long form [Gammaproteobacteria bacterium]